MASACMPQRWLGFVDAARQTAGGRPPGRERAVDLVMIQLRRLRQAHTASGEYPWISLLTGLDLFAGSCPVYGDTGAGSAERHAPQHDHHGEHVHCIDAPQAKGFYSSPWAWCPRTVSSANDIVTPHRRDLASTRGRQTVTRPGPETGPWSEQEMGLVQPHHLLHVRFPC